MVVHTETRQQDPQHSSRETCMGQSHSTCKVSHNPCGAKQRMLWGFPWFSPIFSPWEVGWFSCAGNESSLGQTEVFPAL